jgi:hypothetical protein
VLSIKLGLEADSTSVVTILARLVELSLPSLGEEVLIVNEVVVGVKEVEKEVYIPLCIRMNVYLCICISFCKRM